MADILRSPLRLRLRASRPSSFPCFHTLYVHSQKLFSEPSRYRNTNAIPSFAPLRSPKRRAGFRLLSKSNSNSDFGLISAAERSDGSIVFRFGNAKDYETMVASLDVNKADDAATEGLENADSEELNERIKTTSQQVISHPERRQSSYSTQVIGEVKTVLDGDSRVVDSVSNAVSELTVSLLEETVIDTQPKDLLCSKSSVDEASFDDNKDVVTKDTSLKVEKVINEVIGSNVDEKTESMFDNGVIADSVSSKLDSCMDLSNNSAAQASSKESADTEVASFTTADTENGSISSEANISTETPAEVSLDEKMSPSTFDGYVEANETENSIQLGHNASSTNGEEVGVSKSDTSNVEELPIPGIVEFHSIEDTTDRQEISTGGFVLSSGAVLLRNPSKGLTDGADAYFVAENFLGVADGIGQWSLEGTSEGLFARELMETCERIISHCEGTPVNDPGEVLLRSVAETKSPGSSTILVAHFDGQAFHVANIGDSGFMIIRNGALFQQSSPVVHEFNFPFHVESGDDPSEHIEAYKFDLEDGDVIVTATDGLFDNLYDHDIVAIVSESLEAGSETQEIAESLASKSQELGQSSSSRSPFADTAQAAGYTGYSGGKLDDVAVIVSLVQKRPSS